MDPAKPSLDLLRSLTDEHVLKGLMRHRRLTRAELSTETGISKPTVGESVRRLTELGLVVDTGERTPGGRGRGRVGSYYALAADAGTALAVTIGPEGIVAETVNAYGETVGRAERTISRPARPDEVAAALSAAALDAAVLGGSVAGKAGMGGVMPGGVMPGGASHKTGSTGAMPRLAVVSAADPVDRATGRLVQLPDAPFLLGVLDPVAVLTPLVDGPITVDNDVNWAARSESGSGLDHAAYVFLGEGLGCALISDGEVRRGGAGLAGEIAHLITVGPNGVATPLIEVFGQLHLRQPGSTAIDVERLLASPAAVHEILGQAVAGVIAAVVALADPEVVIVGGSWGTRPAILDAVTTAVARLPRHVPIRTTALTVEPALAGARTDAVNRLRSAIVATAAAVA